MEPSAASSRINQYEHGVHIPHLETAQQLAELLGVPTAFFFAEDDELAKFLVLWGEMSPSERKKLLKHVETARSRK